MWTAIISGAVAAFKWLTSRASTAIRLGRAEAHREQEKATRDAEERMDKVGPSSKRDTIDKLRRNGF